MPEPRLTPEQDADLRRLLSEARHTDPMPEDVAQRLDRVLAGLRTEGDPAVAPVADLGRRRDASRARRRTAVRLLVAAAAVLVVGVGIGQVVGRGSSSSNEDSASSSAPVDRGSTFAGASGEAGSSSDGSPGAVPGAPVAPGPGRAGLTRALRSRLPVTLSSTRLGRDVSVAAALAARERLQPGTAALRDPPSGWSCAGTFTVTGGADLVLPAVYDGTPALLVLSPTDAGHQRARVLACGTFRSLRSLVVQGS